MDELTGDPTPTKRKLRPSCHRCGAPLADWPFGHCPDCPLPLPWPEHIRHLTSSALHSLGLHLALRELGFLRRVRTPRFTRGEVLGTILLLAMLCARPLLLLPAIATILVVGFCRAGLTLLESLAVVACLALAILVSLPGVTPDHSHRNQVLADEGGNTHRFLTSPEDFEDLAPRIVAPLIEGVVPR